LFCAARCSAAQGSYVNVVARTPLVGEFRVCAPQCAAVYAACSGGTFDGAPSVLAFESASDLCGAVPVLGLATKVVPSSGKCFAGRETDQRHASILFGPGTGGGLTLVQHSFTVQAVDGFGQLVTTGGDERRIGVDGPNRFEPNVTDARDGTYVVSYTPQIGGVYAAEVTLRGQRVDVTPVFVSVTAASLCPLYGEEARSAKPPASALCPRYADNACCTQDAQLQAVQQAQDDFAATFANEPACQAFFARAACGTYCSPEQAIFYEPNSNTTTAGATFAICDAYCQDWYAACRNANLAIGPVSSIYPTHVAFCEANAPRGAFAVVVRDQKCFGDAPSRTSCRDSYASGDGLFDWTTGAAPRDLFAGDTASFTIQAVDIYQNLQRAGGDRFAVAFPGVVPLVVDNRDGTYTVTYSATRAGRYNVSVTCNERREEIEHAPFPVVVRPGPYDRAELQCPPTGQTGRRAVFTALAKDRFNNTLDASPKRVLRARVTGPNGFRATPDVIDNCDGTYAGSFVPPAEGRYTVVLIDDNNVELDTCVVVVVVLFTLPPTPAPLFGEPCANTSLITGAGVVSLGPDATAAQVRSVRQFTIETRDAAGQPTEVRTARFRVDFFVDDPLAGLINIRNPANEPVPSVEARDTFQRLFPIVEVTPDAQRPGTYLVTYQTIVASTFFIYVYLEGTSACSGLVTGRPLVVPGNCQRECAIGGVCVVPSDTAPRSAWACECFRPTYQPCAGLVTDNAWIDRFPALMGMLPFCCPSAPVVTKLAFADAPSTSLVVEFSTETNQAGMYGDAPCGAVLADVAGRGLAPLGVGAYCAWQDRRTLLVWFGSNATVQVGDAIVLRDSSVYSAAFPSGPALADQAVKLIGAPTAPPVPRVLIAGQENYNPCVPLELDARLSTGGGGRPMAFQWALLTPTGTNAALAALKAFVAAQTGARFVVPTSLRNQLAASARGRSLQFTAVARNHFGVASGAPATFESKIEFDVAAPQVRVLPPAARVFRGRELKLVADVVDTTRAECQDPLVPQDRSLDFTWRQVRGPVFDMGVTTIKTLYIAPGVLLPGEAYEFEVEAAYASRPGLASVAHVTLDVASSPLVAVIAGGDRRVPLVGGRALALDASDSFDPDETGRALAYAWTIVDDETDQPLLGSVDSATLLNAGTNGQARVSVPANKLRAGVYRATVTVTQPGDPANRQATAAVVLTIVDAAGPVVRIAGPVGGLFSPAERLVLRGVVDADARDGPVALRWQAVGGLFDLEQNRSRLATTSRDVNLVVLPGTFGAGQSYVFRLEATNDGGSGFAELRVTANARPNAGECVPVDGGQTPTSGVAVLTEFTVLCTNFDDAPTQTPLAYRAFRRPVGASDATRDFPLSLSSSASPLVRFRLLDTTQVVIRISDALGATTEYVVPQTYALVRNEATPAQLLSQLELELYGPTGSQNQPNLSDADRLINAADIIAQILKQAGVAGTRKRQQTEGAGDGSGLALADASATRDRLVATITAALEVERTPSTVATRVVLLNAIVQSGPISGASRAAVIDFLATVAVPTLKGASLPGDSVQAIVDLTGAVLATASDLDLSTSKFGRQVRETLAAVSASELASMVAFENERAYVYKTPATPAPAGAEAGDDDQDEIEIQLKLKKQTVGQPVRQINLAGVSFDLPAELAAAAAPRNGAAASDVGYEGLTVRRQIYRWAVGSRRARSQYGINGISVFDAAGQRADVSAAALAGAPIEFVIVLDPKLAIDLQKDAARNGTDGLCLQFDGAAFSTRNCQSVEHDAQSVKCACSALADFSAGIGTEQLPSGAGPIDVPGVAGARSDYLWLILLLLILLWFTLCVVFLLVLAHRRNKKSDGSDTLAPYIDKAAGMGVLALLGDGDVSDSSELERRDYALPVGVYQIPDATEESDLRRDDFSWALEGESESIAGIGAHGGREEASDASEIGRADTYKESRLGKLAGQGAAGATATKRVLMDTEIDLEGAGDPDGNVAKPKTGTTAELARPGATATTKTRRDD
jgi:hypothetical protein